MERFIRVILLCTFISSLLAFNCDTVTNSSQCAQLTGCTWTDPACGGTFAPACTTTLCYYIDPAGGVDTNAGAALTPLKTLTAGFQKLAGKTGNATLIVLNYNWETQVEIFNYTTITTAITITINRQFSDSQYVINMQNFDLTTIPAGSSMAMYITAGKVEFIGAQINANTVKTGVTTVFELGNAKLFLKDTNIKNYLGSAVLVNAATDKTTAQFNYTGGTYWSSSFTFQLQAGATSAVHVFKDIRFLNNYATDYLIYALPGVEITNVKVQGGSSIFFKSLTPQVTLTNLTIKDYTGTALDLENINKFILTTSNFANISVSSSVPFIRLTNGGSTLTSTHSFYNLTFTNISVKHSVLLVEKGGQRLTMDLIKMDDIKKISTADSPTLLDLEYESDFPGGVCFLGRKSVAFTVQNSSFSNIGSHCGALKGSALAVLNTTFNNTGLEYTEVKVAEDKMDESMGVTWLYFLGGTTDVSPGSALRISQCKFLENKKRPLYGGAIRITGAFSVTLTVSECQFYKNKAFYGGAVFMNNPLMTTNFTANTFDQNQAVNGGALYKQSDGISSPTGKANTVLLVSTNLTDNSATGKGGAIFLDYETLKLETSRFTRNTAENGGGIYFIRPNPKVESLERGVRNSTFDSNYASNSGHAMKILFQISRLLPNATDPLIFINNTESNGQNVSDGRPSYYMFSFYEILSEKKTSSNDNYTKWINDRTLTKLVYTLNSTNIPADFQLNHKSGSGLNQLVMAQVYDDYNNAVTYINKETVAVEISATQNNRSDFEAFIAGNIATFTFDKGIFFMKSTIKIVGEPKTTATLTFTGSADTSTLLNDALSLMAMSWPVYFTDCQVGDIYNPLTKKCDTCPEGSYSIVDPYSNAVCVDCDTSKAICPGGEKIAPKPGFWRFSSTSDTVLECPESEACIGGMIDDEYYPTGNCTAPYKGNMCNTCYDTFAKFGDSPTCVNCTTDAMYYVKFTGYFLIQIIALLYGVKCNVSKMSNVKKAHLEDNQDLKEKLKNEDFQSNLMKIAVNFLQVSAIVIQYKFEWPQFILDFVGVTNKIFPTQKEGFSMDCLIVLITGENEYTYFIKLIITLVQPFVLWVVLILFYALYLKIKKQPIQGNSGFKKDIVVLFIITAFILQPTVMQTTLQMFKCQNLNSTDNPLYFMVDNSETECWTPFHLLWSVGIALPNFLLWAIVLPGVLLRMLVKKAKELKNPEIYARFSFVYEGLKTDKYYWEFVVLSRKMLVVLIFVFFNFISVQSQAFATFLVVIGFGCLHYVFWPYNDERLNKAEMVALISLGVMVYCGMFFLSNGGNEWLYTILIVISLIFNVFFFIYLAVLFIKSYKKTAVRMTKKISEAIEKRKTQRSGSKSNNSSISSEKKNTVMDIQDLSLVLGKVQIENAEFPGSPTPMLQQISEGLRLADHERHGEDDDGSIPSELNVHRWTSGKTVFNEEKVDVDNYSVLRSSVRRSEVRTKRNSGATVVTPDLFQDVIHLYNMQRSSLANSNDQKYLGKSFSLFEKAEGPLQKEGQQEIDEVNEDKRPEDPVESPAEKIIKQETEEKPEDKIEEKLAEIDNDDDDDENKRRSNNSDDNNQE